MKIESNLLERFRNIRRSVKKLSTASPDSHDIWPNLEEDAFYDSAQRRNVKKCSD